MVAFLAAAAFGISFAVAEEKSLSQRQSADAASRRVEFEVRFAHEIFLGKWKDKPDELVDVNLWNFVLRADSSDEIDVERRLLVDRNYPQAFIARFDAAVRLIRALDDDDGSRAYKLHKKYETRIEDLSYKSLSLMLGQLAVRKDYPPALRDRADSNFASKKQEDKCTAHQMMKRLIEGGDIDAAVELGLRYKDGDGLPRDDVNALYWLTYAGMRGKVWEVEDDANEVFARISANDRRRVERHLRISGHPLCP